MADNILENKGLKVLAVVGLFGGGGYLLYRVLGKEEEEPPPPPPPPPPPGAEFKELIALQYG